jgi:hypothetical protein
MKRLEKQLTGIEKRTEIRRAERERGADERKDEDDKDEDNEEHKHTETDTDSEEDCVPICQTLQTVPKTRTYQGSTFISETGNQKQPDDNEGDSDGKEDVVLGQGAVGVQVARDFEELGVFRGVVESVEIERKRFYYNIIYEDGDKEEWNEGQYIFGCELRQALEAGTYEKGVSNGDELDVASLDEESDYSADREEREFRKKPKKRKREKEAELSDVLLSKLCPKSVSAEEFKTLDDASKKKVHANVDKHTKKVVLHRHYIFSSIHLLW